MKKWVCMVVQHPVQYWIITCVGLLLMSCGAGNRVTSQTKISENMIIQDYAAYNLWANERYVTWLRGATEEMFHKEVESSFRSLYKTVAHLWNAEYGWLNTLQREPWGTPPGVGFDGSPEALMQGWLSTSQALLEWVGGLNETDWNALYTREEGQRIGTTEEILLHVFNHATYHRGQLITLGRQLGLTNPPRADYIYYIKER